MLSLIAITSSNYLESIKGDIDEKINGIDKHTWLNELVSITTTWGDYSNVLDHYQLTFMPELRLKLYLELLHQTNITPDSLGQILRATTELTKMFMTAESLSKTLTAFEQKLDSSIETPMTNINRLHANFGENPIDLFKDIFHRIATHTSTKPKDIILESFERLIQAGGSSDTLVNASTHLANDSTLDVKNRLFAARELLKIDPAKPETITAYNQIMETSNNSSLEEEEKISHLIEIGVALHKAGVVQESMQVLSKSLADLIKGINAKKRFSFINTYDVIAATEILFNAGKIQNKETAIGLIKWAVFHPYSGAFLQESMILGAEVAERIGDLTASHEYLDRLDFFEEREAFKDRITILKAKLATTQSSQ